MRDGCGAQLCLRRLRWPAFLRRMRTGAAVVSIQEPRPGPRLRRIIPHRGLKRRALSRPNRRTRDARLNISLDPNLVRRAMPCSGPAAILMQRRVRLIR